MTPKEAMRLYCQTTLRLLDWEHLRDGDLTTLETLLDDLGPLVYGKLADPEQDRWRLQALGELHVAMMGEDVELSALAS